MSEWAGMTMSGGNAGGSLLHARKPSGGSGGGGIVAQDGGAASLLGGELPGLFGGLSGFGSLGLGPAVSRLRPDGIAPTGGSLGLALSGESGDDVALRLALGGDAMSGGARGGSLLHALRGEEPAFASPPIVPSGIGGTASLLGGAGDDVMSSGWTLSVAGAPAVGTDVTTLAGAPAVNGATPAALGSGTDEAASSSAGGYFYYG